METMINKGTRAKLIIYMTVCMFILGMVSPPSLNAFVSENDYEPVVEEPMGPTEQQMITVIEEVEETEENIRVYNLEQCQIHYEAKHDVYKDSELHNIIQERKRREKEQEEKRRILAQKEQERLERENKITNIKFDKDNVRILTGANAKTINLILEGTHLAGFGELFIEMEKEYEVNCLFSISNAIQESGWNGSNLSRNYNNLFGISISEGFRSKEACIEYWFNLIDKYYVGEGLYSIESIQGKYCPPDSSWDDDICRIAKKLKAKINN